MAGLEHAKLTDSVSGVSISVLFNPEEYTVSRDTTFAQIAVPGLSAPIVQFVHGNARTLEMELLVDSYEASDQAAAGSDVRLLTDRIVGLMDIAPSLHAPPPVIFSWGSLSFTCVLQRCVQRYILFRADGVPVRARLQVTFSEFKNVEMEAREIKRETADYTKVHVVCQDETLPGIAFATYGDAVNWRPIALRNALDNPRALQPGMRLALPRLPFRDPESGEVYA
jgi:nucleoid-associated protein YgaU